MKKYKTALILSYVLIFAVLAAGSATMWLYTSDIKATACVSALLLAAFLLSLLPYYINRRQTSRLLEQLSDMISSISLMKAEPVFSVIDDSLLSKLQSQVIRLTETLQGRNREVEQERNEIKSLISDISHQLKTPVATLKTYGELILDNDTSDEEREKYFTSFSAALERLAFLTDSLVKLSRLESGVIALKPEKADLGETVLAAVMQTFEKATQKNIEIIFDNDACKIELLHDKSWTAEAIFNLLDNAVKYSPSGSNVEITLTKYELFARIDVADRGIGIPEDEQSRVFGRFYRGQNAHSQQGAGIGLYLTRKILTDQGGYIKLKSDGCGTVFSAFLPL